MIITPEACEYYPRHLLTLVATRRARDWFRRRFWLRCWTCPHSVGPFTTAKQVADSLGIANDQLRSIDIIRAAGKSIDRTYDKKELDYVRDRLALALDISEVAGPRPTAGQMADMLLLQRRLTKGTTEYDMKQLLYIKEKLYELTGMKYAVVSDMMDEFIRRYKDVVSKLHNAPPGTPHAIDTRDAEHVRICGKRATLELISNGPCDVPILLLRCGLVTFELPTQMIRDAVRATTPVPVVGFHESQQIPTSRYLRLALDHANPAISHLIDPTDTRWAGFVQRYAPPAVPTFRGIPIEDTHPLSDPPGKFPYEPRRDA